VNPRRLSAAASAFDGALGDWDLVEAPSPYRHHTRLVHFGACHLKAHGWESSTLRPRYAGWPLVGESVMPARSAV
jgi:hypothetical protein